MVTGEGHQQIQELVSPLVERWKIFQPRVRLAASGAPLEPSACTALLVGQEVLLEDRRHYAPATRWGFDSRLGIVEELATSEKEYNADLSGVFNLYAKPLKRLISMHEDEYKALFDWIEPILSISSLMTMKLHAALEHWDSQHTKIGFYTSLGPHLG
ncbi:hypothetical protein HPB52_017416 [Rhipicephalus sanguineus]|uniref:DH domain-containing protein n=1 Tax=Rhipicephalus sanguineus TaxID=34632 RepID=A0A9D4PMZ2_RHISA|nr:hypothetical protein HPB52_017416 [Rhipicephalus sanguineus]